MSPNAQGEHLLSLSLKTVKRLLQGDRLGFRNRALSLTLGLTIEGIENLTWVAQPGFDVGQDGRLDLVGPY